MKMKLVWTSCLMAACLSVVTSPVFAAITYVDANFAAGGNTTLTDGITLPVITTDGGSGGTGADGLWRLRTNLQGNNSSIYEANGDFNAGANTEDVQRVLTTITGLTPGGKYNVFGYFVGNHPDMRIGLSLSDDVGQLPVYTVGQAGTMGTGVTQVSDADLANFSNTVTNDVFNVQNGLYQASLGMFQASGTGTIGVYVDDDTTVDRSADGGSLRTVYEGVGFEVVPEPGSLTLLGICLCGLAFRRVS